MAEKHYSKLSGRYRKSYLRRLRCSLKDLKSGTVHRMTAQRLIDKLCLEA